MSENFPLFDPRVNLALMSFTRFEASHDVTIFTINSRYAINTRTWINRSVFALASPVASSGRGNRSRINIRVSFVCIMQMRPCARNILHDGGGKTFGFFARFTDSPFSLFHFRARSFRLFSSLFLDNPIYPLSLLLFFNCIADSEVG